MDDQQGTQKSSSPLTLGGAVHSLVSQPRQLAGVLFLAAFCLAVVLIGADIMQPWSPSAVVVTYAYTLWRLQRRRVLALTTEVKDSAYFLGFALNLAFLFFAFRDYGVRPSTEAIPYIVRALGSAITTTLVGLVARYILHLFDDDELVQKHVFMELQEEVKNSVAGFRQSQRSLAHTIKAFVDARDELLKRDKAATSAYLSQMEGFLSELQSVMSRQLESLVKISRDFKVSGEDTLAALNGLNHELTRLKEGLGPSVPVTALANLKQATEGASTSLRTLLATLDGSSSAFRSMHGLAQATQDDLKAVDGILSDFIRVAEEHVDGLRLTRSAL